MKTEWMELVQGGTQELLAKAEEARLDAKTFAQLLEDVATLPPEAIASGAGEADEAPSFLAALRRAATAGRELADVQEKVRRAWASRGIALVGDAANAAPVAVPEAFAPWARLRKEVLAMSAAALDHAESFRSELLDTGALDALRPAGVIAAGMRQPPNGPPPMPAALQRVAESYRRAAEAFEAVADAWQARAE